MAPVFALRTVERAALKLIPVLIALEPLAAYLGSYSLLLPRPARVLLRVVALLLLLTSVANVSPPKALPAFSSIVGWYATPGPV